MQPAYIPRGGEEPGVISWTRKLLIWSTWGKLVPGSDRIRKPGQNTFFCNNFFSHLQSDGLCSFQQVIFTDMLRNLVLAIQISWGCNYSWFFSSVKKIFQVFSSLKILSPKIYFIFLLSLPPVPKLTLFVEASGIFPTCFGSWKCIWHLATSCISFSSSPMTVKGA